MVATIVSGTITGRAAACSNRSSTSVNRRYGSTDRDIRSASTQPGCIGSGVSVRASSTALQQPRRWQRGRVPAEETNAKPRSPSTSTSGTTETANGSVARQVNRSSGDR